MIHRHGSHMFAVLKASMPDVDGGVTGKQWIAVLKHDGQDAR
jgi:hypothetical protein